MMSNNRMLSGLTNLVPSRRQNKWTRDYFFRIATVAVFLMTLLVVTAGVLLFPTYIYLVSAEKTKLARLEKADNSLSSPEETDLASRLQTLSHDAQALVLLKDINAISRTINSLLSVSRPGITISGVAFNPATEEKGNTVSVIGTALTRESLRSYQIALDGASFSSSANLPVSAYAKESNIPFTIVVTLSP